MYRSGYNPTFPVGASATARRCWSRGASISRRVEMRSIRCVAVLAALIVPCAAAVQASASFSVHVLSNRADLITGGEALASVTLPRAIAPSSVTVTLNGSNVTNEFALRPNGSYEGLVDGLHPGANSLRAEAPGGLSSQVAIEDHPIGGPLFSGPQVKP